MLRHGIFGLHHPDPLIFRIYLACPQIAEVVKRLARHQFLTGAREGNYVLTSGRNYGTECTVGPQRLLIAKR